jgi:hypothetical protein
MEAILLIGFLFCALPILVVIRFARRRMRQHDAPRTVRLASRPDVRRRDAADDRLTRLRAMEEIVVYSGGINPPGTKTRSWSI